MNLPNQLTVIRILLTFVFVGCTSFNGNWVWTVGLILFIVASVTDYFDGKIARDRGLVTSFGKLMDPLADKILMAAAFVMLCEKGLFWGWAVVAILAREFLVTGIRLLAASEGKVLPAENLGKWKTAIQMLTVIVIMGFLAGKENLIPGFGWLFSSDLLGNSLLHSVLIIASVVITIWSGIGYLVAGKDFIKDA